VTVTIFCHGKKTFAFEAAGYWYCFDCGRKVLVAW
jgi:hypothetical protein